MQVKLPAARDDNGHGVIELLKNCKDGRIYILISNYVAQNTIALGNAKTVDEAKLLAERGVNLSIIPWGVFPSPLHLAVKNNNLELVKYFLSSGSDVNLHNAAVPPPLAWADNVEIAKLLLTKGANGEYALGCAVRNNDLAAAKVLLTCGINASIFVEGWRYDSYDKRVSALGYAVKNNNLKMAELLADNGARYDRENWYDLMEKNSAMFVMLLEKGAFSGVDNGLMHSSVLYAFNRKDIKMAKALLSKQVQGHNPIDKETLNKLLVRCVDNVTDGGSNDIRAFYLAMAELLLDGGADANVRYDSGSKLIDCIVANIGLIGGGHWNVKARDLLLKYGAKSKYLEK